MSISSTDRSPILLVSDIAGHGKVGLSAMIPVLSQLRQNVSTLPTALVSNTFDYGKFSLIDTTDYMREALGVWEDLGFSFDAIFVGFLASPQQSDLVRAYCEGARKADIPIFFDPIMGDWGKLYNGVSEDDVSHRKLMCAVADVIVPNLTEAQYLCGESADRESVDSDEALRLIRGLRELGATNIVITSAQLDDRCCTIVSEVGDEGFDAIEYEELPLQMPGTGDIFSSSLMGSMLEGRTLKESVRFAMDVVSRLLERCLENPDCLHGIPVEAHLEDVLEEAGWTHG